mmetsp:Transcript_19272/g.41421  ORF Transcript_19272/g.41421 Transcript_19272/m.41421 type:complete len:129 (-) Transcript_19272:44-430(-)
MPEEQSLSSSRNLRSSAGGTLASLFARMAVSTTGKVAPVALNAVDDKVGGTTAAATATTAVEATATTETTTDKIIDQTMKTGGGTTMVIAVVMKAKDRDVVITTPTNPGRKRCKTKHMLTRQRNSLYR